MMHTTADDPKRYRTDKEVEQWRKRDPLPRFQQYLTARGLLSEDGVTEIETEVMQEIQAAVDRAEEKMKTIGDPVDMFEHAYEEMPPYLAEQKAEFERELVATDKEANDG
jgi:pyruvate dehydrogenase E1 component alpha subunit